jgi:NAD(P)-dependent dehydrogenase (short-subunit alcohol dehydrogenase family)
MNALQKLAQRYPHKRILITGATSGLGEALAMQFAAAGFKVAVASRNPAKVAITVAAVNSAGGEGLAVTVDVSRVEDIEAAVAKVEAAWGGLDILVNNAGVLTAGKMEVIGREPWVKSINTDLWSVIDGCRLFLPLLEHPGGGHIVNVASAAGLVAAPDMGTYNVAKAAVISLSETLRVELAEKNIDVTVSCPTVFKSHLIDTESHEGDTLVGVAAKGLANDMAHTSISSEDVATSLINAMARRRMYDVPQLDARLSWWMSRAFPETFRKIMLLLYRHRLWVFKEQ